METKMIDNEIGAREDHISILIVVQVLKEQCSF